MTRDSTKRAALTAAMGLVLAISPAAAQGTPEQVDSVMTEPDRFPSRTSSVGSTTPGVWRSCPTDACS